MCPAHYSAKRNLKKIKFEPKKEKSSAGDG